MMIGVVGSRRINNDIIIYDVLNNFCDKEKDIIISGGAKGVDSIAEKYAINNRMQYIIYYPKTYNREGYFNRNSYIVESSDIVLAFPDKDSRGTWDTINKALKMKKRVIIFNDFMGD